MEEDLEEELELGEGQVGSLGERVIRGDVIEYLGSRWWATLFHESGCSSLTFDTCCFIYFL